VPSHTIGSDVAPEGEQKRSRIEKLGLIGVNAQTQTLRMEIERLQEMLKDGLITKEQYDEMQASVVRNSGLVD
jgi:hypothetical protein